MTTPNYASAEELPDGEYAIVEIMGHVKLVGRIAEVERFGAKMIAVEPLFGGLLLPAVYYGGSAIYGLTPCGKAAAWKAKPTRAYELPSSVSTAQRFDLLVEHQRDAETADLDEEMC